MRNEIFTKNEVVIDASNVKTLGEYIAIKATKMIKNFSNGTLDKLYRDLVNDIYYHNEPEPYSCGYDIASTAICFLCQYIGKRLGDICRIDKNGEPISIKRACYTAVNKYIDTERHCIRINKSFDNLKRYEEPKTMFEIGDKVDFSLFEYILDNLNMTALQEEILYCFMQKMTFTEIATTLSVSRATVFRRKKELQAKCLKIVF